ncbi:MAG: PilN domain-containing protein [Gammaproteobacteria bacterium]
MININLLPWRIQLQKEKQREFVFLIIVGLVCSIFLCIVIHIYLAAQLSRQSAINDYLLQQISQVDQKIAEVNNIKQQKNDLIKRLYIIHQLQTSRVELVEMFNNFANVLPEGIYITSIKKQHNIITITGQARSNQQVSQLMKNIAASNSFVSPVLTEIQDNTNQTQQTKIDEMYPLGFEMQVKQETEMVIDEKTTPSPSFTAPTVTPPGATP